MCACKSIYARGLHKLHTNELFKLAHTNYHTGVGTSITGWFNKLNTCTEVGKYVKYNIEPSRIMFPRCSEIVAVTSGKLHNCIKFVFLRF